MFDYTRLTQFGGWEGWIEVDGELIDLEPGRDVGFARSLVGRATGRRTRPVRCTGRRPAVLLAVGAGQLRDVLDPLRRQRAVRRQALARDRRRRPGRHRRRRAPRGDAVDGLPRSGGRRARGTPSGSRSTSSRGSANRRRSGSSRCSTSRCSASATAIRSGATASGRANSPSAATAGTCRSTNPNASEHVHIQAIVRATTSGGDRRARGHRHPRAARPRPPRPHRPRRPLRRLATDSDA